MSRIGKKPVSVPAGVTASVTGQLVKTFTLKNFQQVFTNSAYLETMVRTVSIAVLVTVLALVIGVPLAFFMARVASSRWQPLLVALVLTPLWASYLVKVYAWRAMLQPENGVVAWFLQPFGLSGPGYGFTAIVITLTNGYEGSLLSGIPHNIHKEIAALEMTGTKAMLIIAGTPPGVNLLDPKQIEPALKAGYERAKTEAPKIAAFWA